MQGLVGEYLSNVVPGCVVGGESYAVPLKTIRGPPGPSNRSFDEPCPGESAVSAVPESLVDPPGRSSYGVRVAVVPRELVEVDDGELAGCEPP